jgi:hypothetical protein
VKHYGVAIPPQLSLPWTYSDTMCASGGAVNLLEFMYFALSWV